MSSEPQRSETRCTYCAAPDNGTCAYPSEGKPGCLLPAHRERIREALTSNQKQAWDRIEAQYAELCRKYGEQRDDYERLRAALIGVMECSGTGTRHYHIARDALRGADETTELHRLRTEMLEVNKALGLDRDNQDNALRVKTALRLRLPVEPTAHSPDATKPQT